MLDPVTLVKFEYLAKALFAAKEAANKQVIMNSILVMCKQHGGAVIAEAVSTGGFSAAELAWMERAVLKQAQKQAAAEAAKKGMTIGLKEFLKQFGKNFGRGPKGPGPIMLAVLLGTFLMSAEGAYAETMQHEADCVAHRNYLDRYGKFLAKRIQQSQLNRGGHVPYPMDFDEWKANREYISL